MTTATEARAEYPGRAVPGGDPDPEPTTAEFRAWRAQGRAWFQEQGGAGSCYTFGAECPPNKGSCPFCGETNSDWMRWCRWVSLYSRKWGTDEAETEKRLLRMQLRGENPDWGLRNEPLREPQLWPEEAFYRERREK